MQDLLSYAINALIFAAPVYFATMFVLGWSDRRTAPLEQPAPTVLCAEDEAIASQLSDLWIASAPVKPAGACLSEARIVDAVVPFIRPQPKSPTVADLPDWSALDPFQLRKECQARGIVWRNAHGKNRHLKKSEMVAALRSWEGAIAS